VVTRQTIDVAQALGESEIFGALLEEELAQLVQLGTRARNPPAEPSSRRVSPATA
jgi:hypothetical protein